MLAGSDVLILTEAEVQKLEALMTAFIRMAAQLNQTRLEYSDACGFHADFRNFLRRNETYND